MYGVAHWLLLTPLVSANAMWYWHSAVIAYYNYRQIRVPAWHSRPRLDDKVFISRELGEPAHWPELWVLLARTVD